MQNRILDFTNILRRAGIRVSTAETLDAFQALEVLSIDDREVFRDALGATMVKRAPDVSTFNELFDLYWSGFYDSLRESLKKKIREMREEGLVRPEMFIDKPVDPESFVAKVRELIGS